MKIFRENNFLHRNHINGKRFVTRFTCGIDVYSKYSLLICKEFSEKVVKVVNSVLTTFTFFFKKHSKKRSSAEIIHFLNQRTIQQLKKMINCRKPASLGDSTADQFIMLCRYIGIFLYDVEKLEPNL